MYNFREFRLDSLHLNNVSFIKIDVENAENQVLQGARQTILHNRPIIILEILGSSDNQPAHRDVGVMETINFLVQLGYIVKPFTNTNYLATPIQSLCIDLGWNGNV